MSSPLSVKKTLNLLEQLQAAIAKGTARERELNQKFQSKLDVLKQQQSLAADALSTKLAEDIQQASERLQKAKAAARTRFERRRNRIGEAWKQSQQQAFDRIEAREGHRTFKLQTETMQAARVRKEGLAATEKAYSDFNAELEVEHQSVLQLDAAVREAFQGYGRFTAKLTKTTIPEPDTAQDEYALIGVLRQTHAKAEEELKRFRRFIAPHFFRYTYLWVPLILAQFLAVPVLQMLGKNSFSYVQAGESTAILFVLGFVLHFLGRLRCEREATTLASTAVQSRKLCDSCLARCEARHTRETERIEAEHQAKNQWITEQWGQALNDSEQMKGPALAKVDEKKARISENAEKLFALETERLERAHAQFTEALQRETKAQLDELTSSCSDKESTAKKEFDAQWNALQADWKSTVTPLYNEVITAQSFGERAWDASVVDNWAPPASFESFARLARLEVDLAKMSDGLLEGTRLARPGPAKFDVPLFLKLPEQGSALLETSEATTDSAAGVLNNIVLRLLSKSPPGRLNFTIFDPVGLGQNFAGIMHLADYEEHLINSRIWTQPKQMEEKLAELNEHMEKVIQMYLRNEYATIAEYNEQAGNIAEKYHFLVVANFPAGFTESAIKRLLSIAASGSRCGVYTLIHWDHRQPAPAEFVPDELVSGSVRLVIKGNRFLLNGANPAGTTVIPDQAPESELAIRLVHKIGLASRDSNRVEVPFNHVTPQDEAMWSVETTSELRVALGRTGATKLQYLALGKGTRQHALVAGKTGSGKSTLFHVAITNLALWCSPEQVEFYLVDFKKGVEFKCYATKRLPHARVVAIESDREFGLSVLQRVDAELKRRGDLFRQLGVQDLAGYKRAGGKESLPRTLLIIDEFQEFFVEDDKVSQGASLLLDRIVRQGRAFGIHAILGSQTLGGAYTMARTTLGQMVVRIALQCNEADSYLIMDENNAAPRLLSRPGEGIYNDSAGALEGNSPFQTVWLSDDDRDAWLDKVRAKADESAAKAGTTYPGPIVYEGDAPADVRENPLLQELLAKPSVTAAAVPRIWLGAPNSIKGPTEAAFQRQSGNHLLIVGQRDEAILASFATAVLALAAQHPDSSAKFILADASAPGSTHREYIEKLVASIPRPVTLARNSDLPEIMAEVSAQLSSSSEESEAGKPTFLLVHGLQKFSKLRYEEDFAFSSDPSIAAHPAVRFNTMLCEGASRGLHVIASCDSYSNLTRFLSRKALGEFEMRVLFQMSSNDSASLIDSPRAGALGLHRALFHNAKEGYLEVFRPYALPEIRWIQEAARPLKA